MSIYDPNQCKKTQSYSKKLIKQTSSPLISRKQFVGNIYGYLTYERIKRIPAAVQNHVKKGTKRDDKKKKLPIAMSMTDYKSQKKQTIQSSSILSLIAKKNSIDLLERQRKHFNFDSNPEMLRMYRAQSPQEDQLLNVSKYRKIKNDFAQSIDFSGISNLQNMQNAKGKRCNYRLDMFKEGSKIGMKDFKSSSRRSNFFRAHSSIQFG